MAGELKPATIVRADYTIAQSPSMGGEVEAYVSLTPCGKIMKVRNIGGSTYETIDYNAAGTFTAGGVYCTSAVVVGDKGLTGEIAGVITVPDYARNKSTRFPVGKAGEGTIGTPSFGVRGEFVWQYELPDFNPDAAVADRNYTKIEGLKDVRLKLPIAPTKNIPAGMNNAAWVTFGRSEVGELSMTALNDGFDDGLLKLGGAKACVMLSIRREGLVEICRIYIPEWAPSVEPNFPEGDSEATVSCTGQFANYAVFAADGTPAT